MAKGTIHGTNYAKTLSNTPTNVLTQGTMAGKVRVYCDYVEVASTSFSDQMSYGSVVIMGDKLPIGAKVVQVILGCDSLSDATYKGTISVGDEGDVDRYLTAKQVSTAAVYFAPTLVDEMAPIYEVTGTTDNYIRLYCASGQPSTGTIRLTVFYAYD
jgi:hypothetical protein